MASAAPAKVYQPRILTPTLKKPVAGVTVRLVESHTPNEFYYVWQTPDGGYRCQCKGASFGNDCCHKKEFRKHLAASLNTEVLPTLETVAAIVTVAAGPQMTFACPRPAQKPNVSPDFQKKLDSTIFPSPQQIERTKANALPYDDGRPFSIFKPEDHNGDYIPSDYYQHAYR